MRDIILLINLIFFITINLTYNHVFWRLISLILIFGTLAAMVLGADDSVSTANLTFEI